MIELETLVISLKLSLRQFVRWNHVYGDIYGNIFYIWNAKVYHRRGDYDYTRPVDGSTSNTEWGELVPLEELLKKLIQRMVSSRIAILLHGMLTLV